MASEYFLYYVFTYVIYYIAIARDVFRAVRAPGATFQEGVKTVVLKFLVEYAPTEQKKINK